MNIEKRIAEFEQKAFGMFIHWGLYSIMGKGEWIQNLGPIPRDEYQKLQEKFTGEGFDAELIARTAKANGMKYITLTTRHHEGFSLYDVRGLNTYDSLHSPAKRDFVREFTDACRKEGIVPFLYHTTLDWYKDEFEHDFESYLKYLYDSVEILCTQYGEIGGLWFDGNWSKPDADWKLDELYGMIRRNQPNAMIINNTGLDQQGALGHKEIDSVTFEQGVPVPIDRSKMDKYIAGEMCYTMNDHWGSGGSDFNFKSPKQLISALCSCRKAGANFLLNVGILPNGKLEPISGELLRIIGRWMEIYGEAVYNGRPCEIIGAGNHFCLKDVESKKLYLFVADLPIIGDPNVTAYQGNLFPAVFTKTKEKISSIRWMDNEEPLAFMQDTNSGILTVEATGFPYGKSHIIRVAVADYI